MENLFDELTISGSTSREVVEIDFPEDDYEEYVSCSCEGIDISKMMQEMKLSVIESIGYDATRKSIGTVVSHPKNLMEYGVL